MKKFFTLFACLFTLHALAINEEQATLVTQNFLKENNITKEDTRSVFSLKEIVKKENMNMFYIMSLGNDEGFVIVPASKYLPPIFGYSFENKCESNPTLQYYLELYSGFILQEEKSKNSLKEEIIKKWEYFLRDEFIPNRFIVNEVTPLITSKWNQDRYYNRYCPWDKSAPYGYDYRVPNGCVALAGAQLMNYYRYPEKGKNLYSYIPSKYPRQTIYPYQQVYNWDAMCDQPTNYTNEISKLTYHLGVAVSMQYAPYGSGAYTQDLNKVLQENYAYSLGIEWVVYDSVKLKQEINSKRPILMSGQNENGGGHAYLVDGYRENPDIMFHFNWGWGGNSDGYFFLDKQFFHNQGTAFINIKPVTNYPEQCGQFKRQTASQGYITNGSTNQPYQSAPDCSWMIAVPGATHYTFSFSRLDTQEDIDVITIYNGSTISSGISGTYSGTKKPSYKTVTADSVLITFTSTNPLLKNSTHTGFLMNYTTNKPAQKCNTITNITASSGYITDGTLPGENYTPWISCTWNIAPEYNTGFFGLFHEFDLSLGDFVEFFDPTTNPPTLITRFDRNTPPTIGEVINFPNPKIKIIFITDNYGQGKGFKFQYFSMVGVNNNSLLDNLSIFPNPATEIVNLSFSSELLNQFIGCRIIDVTGRELYSTRIDYNGDFYTAQIPVAHLSKGIYFLQLTTPTGNITSKIIKN
jgi:hypothetical protein